MKNDAVKNKNSHMYGLSTDENPPRVSLDDFNILPRMMRENELGRKVLESIMLMSII